VDFDKVKEMASEHPDQVNEGIDKGGDFLDEKTGGQHAEQVDKGQEALRNQLGGQGAEGGEQAEQQ
jgi:hypothetical protein